MPPQGAERRTLRRLALTLPIRVRLKHAEGKEVQSLTRDICAGGVYFTMSERCELGSELECHITLPPETPDKQPVLLHCRGKIVRVERPDAANKIGIAATIEEYDLTRSD